jgi:hypothetical protein
MPLPRSKCGRAMPEILQLDAKGAYEYGGQHHGITSEEGARFTVSVCSEELRGGVEGGEVGGTAYL